MTIVFCGIMPHPPIALPEVGGAESDKIMATRKAMLELGYRIKESGAETLVMISPHSTVFGDAIAINGLLEATGDMSRFGAPQVALHYKYDKDLGSEIGWQSEDLGLPVVEVDKKMASKLGVNLELDHGFMVPLYYLAKAGLQLPLVPCSMGVFLPEKLYAFGVAVKNAAEATQTKVAVVASGDLSHRLTPDAPAGYDEKGKEFDQAIVSLIKAMDVPGLINLEEDLCERAGECGLRPITMMLGALDGLAVKSEVLSYEGPFGVGYMIATLTPLGSDPKREILLKLREERKKKLALERARESYLVQVARQSLESYLQGQWKDLASYDIPKEYSGAAGTFVSFKKGGNLRGCIGTTAPTRANIIQEVAYNAVSAGTQDPRFYPIRLDELDELTISVDVLMSPEPISGLDQLDVKRYGVIVRRGSRSGLLLPDLEGVDTPQQQVDIAKQKAGIGPDEEVQLERFEVIRYR
ncbi:Extradiol ring-cleavage dioxygenase, class III enzyme, subunit B [Desulforamulus reducens MI-1]|uniref:Extradiol ring-cleavage dioxygenase, class III enzyme, subunit B n=1 Tax=Desulforamulus reducens (strain ATCC BAA-1160 / DSM 100696 / MI-1) TaxID=349161 RepID=A4J165_DESRM|nr:AmmeMemoRadiSam system protein A [Desulforamulus reducens]ABO48818.1 Extradiol ring-cleavage dioxygenase, class III enzyme, subunit B [Desulforamulus reducens MI-1]